MPLLQICEPVQLQTSCQDQLITPIKREREREGGREGGREAEREGKREREREGKRERGRKRRRRKERVCVSLFSYYFPNIPFT